MAWFADEFNAWVGSNVSHFANASGGTISIAICERTMTISEVSMKDLSIKIEKEKNVGKFKITNRQVYKYKRNNAQDYLTVVRHDGVIICENFRIRANASYIITEDEVMRQKYGDSNMFKDENGNIY
jgi:isopentenyldiphosphate isomerase